MVRKLWNGYWQSADRIGRFLDRASGPITLALVLGVVVYGWLYVG